MRFDAVRCGSMRCGVHCAAEDAGTVFVSKSCPRRALTSSSSVSSSSSFSISGDIRRASLALASIGYGAECGVPMRSPCDCMKCWTERWMSDDTSQLHSVVVSATKSYSSCGNCAGHSDPFVRCSAQLSTLEASRRARRAGVD
jgi:hypothetical protein